MSIIIISSIKLVIFSRDSQSSAASKFIKEKKRERVIRRHKNWQLLLRTLWWSSSSSSSTKSLERFIIIIRESVQHRKSYKLSRRHNINLILGARICINLHWIEHTFHNFKALTRCLEVNWIEKRYEHWLCGRKLLSVTTAKFNFLYSNGFYLFPLF